MERSSMFRWQDSSTTTNAQPDVAFAVPPIQRPGIGMAQQQVKLTDLRPEQLASLKQGLEEELETLQNSMSGLKVATSRFNTSKNTLTSLRPENQDAEMMVPLTSSMYIRGKVGDVSNVLLDVGTGYFVEKDVPAAEAFFDAKLRLMRENMERCQDAIRTKNQQLAMVVQVMQAQAQAQAQAAGRA